MLYFLSFNICKTDFGKLCGAMKTYAAKIETGGCESVFNLFNELSSCEITTTKTDGQAHVDTLKRVLEQAQKITSLASQVCKSEEVSPALNAQITQSGPSGSSGVSIAALVIASFALVGVGALAFMKLRNRNE